MTKMIRLNVGGHTFCLSGSTIMRYPDSMLARMVEQEKERILNNEEVFLDKCPNIFATIVSVRVLLKHFRK